TNYKILNTPDLLWYKLNGNAQDFSKGARTDGTITSSLFTTGKYGTAINFDGVDDKVVIPTAMGLNWDQDWTMSFWIKVPTAIANGEEINILEQYIDATHYFYLVCRASGTPTTTLSFFYHFNTGGGDLSEVGVNLINSWQDTFVFVTMAHDNSANKINGGNKIGTVEETDTNTTASLPDVGFTTEDFEMGRNQAECEEAVASEWDTFVENLPTVDSPVCYWAAPLNAFICPNHQVPIEECPKPVDSLKRLEEKDMKPIG
ncbi:hypothetical protein LCGC14_2458680, partial [marine sediment metagenome]